MPVRVLLVDDQAIIRRVLRSAVEGHADLQVCATEAETGVQALALTESYEPDVVILDHEMPEMTGLEALPEIRRLVPKATIVMYSSVTSPEVSEAALRHGATAFMRKDLDSPEDIVAFIAGMDVHGG